MAKYFRFLSLPAELRFEIYFYLLVDAHGPISLMDNWGFTLERPAHCSFLHPSILRVCSLILGEAAPILYGKNEFDFTWEREDFLEMLGPDNCKLIRHVHLGFEIDGDWCEDKYRLIKRQNKSMTLTQEDYSGADLLRGWCPNLAAITFYTQDGNGLYELWIEDAFQFLKSAVDLFNSAFPGVKRISAPTFARNSRPYAALWAKKQGLKHSWGEICDFLEGNGWVLGINGKGADLREVWDVPDLEMV